MLVCVMREIKEGKKFDASKSFLEDHWALKDALEKNKTPEQIEKSGLGDQFHQFNMLQKRQKFNEENPYLCLVYEFDTGYYSNNGYRLNLRHGKIEDLEFQKKVEKELEDRIGTKDVEVYYEKVFDYYLIKIVEINRYTNLPEIFEENKIALRENNLLGIVDFSQGEQTAKNKCLELITIIAKNFRYVYADDEGWFSSYYYRQRKPEKIYIKKLNSAWGELK